MTDDDEAWAWLVLGREYWPDTAASEWCARQIVDRVLASTDEGHADEGLDALAIWTTARGCMIIWAQEVANVSHEAEPSSI